MCELCELANGNIITTLYYQCDDYLIVDCSTCKVPMVVIVEHTMHPSQSLLYRMRQKARELFGENTEFRGYTQKIHGHWHDHIIRK